MRLLFLSPVGTLGGAERVLLTAVRGVLHERPGAVVRVVALADGPLAGAVRDLGAEVEVVALPVDFAALGDSSRPGGRTAAALRSLHRLPALAQFVSRLRNRVARFAPDLVHSNGIKTHLLARLVVPKGVPLVWHAHDFYGLRPLAGWLLRRSRARVKAVVAISNAVALDVRVILPGVPVRVVPNAVDLDRFCPGAGDGPELDRLAGVPVAEPGTVRVGLVATYARWKGHLTVLDAAARLAAEAPELRVRWYVVGGPIYQTAAQYTSAELSEAVAARGLGDRVVFVPFQTDTAAVYRALDVVVHASTAPEPFGLTIAEAMACGRAGVVSAAGGATELFTDGIDALGFEPGNVGQLSAVIDRLVRDPELRERLGPAARQTALARFDALGYGGKLRDVYREVVIHRVPTSEPLGSRGAVHVR
ncbi:group 1 glycosyl transferase : Group 1 glycosyl transferase OS=Corallococcus coralloides (strain ATCC 25202 / DSM 2259 / NBRC 100086 / M2) GN=mshA4 PE=4 SV=1: Glyco_transf_4: Glycos_transf_1 [Gemmataceae bacterium]|nr:group 1 glycosyl transferase : Group 1 glycosyl transferase OS=Corallococcus coralloides (strain ATCC 25202 / DSM 2259 / NBRC 100086 / M2) GN=mshA4 PE=4 SV=1: Glyco_transf_4: Glycos_transf_1 [Gemmataceae bacterium]VTU00927.1 group 1 glycosyl transferase : Group 1 glycosyl transferase OS=Corallococcus coralloides (strain ATCC 25202 / DSM 2259 / NBRC 100086 / M2) GN=mshA4 PE=4 SV=1: Glyco_transf_4: Glycos_transf_1 [Gemmataceae bacterium]